MYHLAVFQFQCRVFCAGTFPDHSQHTGHSRAAEVILPVQFDQRRQNDGQFQFDRIDGTDFCFQIHITDGGLVRVRFCAHCAKHAAIDIEMGVINGVYLFRCHLIIPCCCGINRIGTAHSRNTDFAGTYAVSRTHGTHAGKRADMLGIAQFCSVERRT